MQNIWNTQYVQGKWDYLEELPEQHRYAIISSYIYSQCSKGSILDVGSGTGILLKFIDLTRYKYTGIDISPIALEHTNYQQPGVAAICSRVEEFSPQQSNSFQVIIFNEILYYLKGPCSEISRYCQFLSPNGLLIVSMYHPPANKPEGAKFVQSIWEEIRLHLNQQLEEIDHTFLCNRTTNREWNIRLYICNNK